MRLLGSFFKKSQRLMPGANDFVGEIELGGHEKG
jgi:hypothetical protein